MNILKLIQKFFTKRKASFYCPSCGKVEVGENYCAKCNLPLLKLVINKDKYRAVYIHMVPIYRPTGLAQLAVIKSILDEAQIKYFVKNESSQNLLGIGTMGFGFNAASGEMVLEVDAARVDEANLLLQSLTETNEDY